MKQTTVWVLTREINQYDQDGEYFQAAWPEKPTRAQLKEALCDPANDALIDRVMDGGGRTEKLEDEWFHLAEHMCTTGENLCMVREPPHCNICKRTLDDPDDATTESCGGDCLRCMAESGDPDCAVLLSKIYMCRREAGDI